MICIDENNDRKPYMSNFKLYHGEDIIERVRRIYYVDAEIRECSIPIVNDEGKLIYFASWLTNNNNPPEDIKDTIYVPEFWEYSVDDMILDMELLEGYDTFEFEKIEEYSYLIAQVILKHFPNKKIIFHDAKAEYFFKNQSGISIDVKAPFIYNPECTSTLYLNTGVNLFDHVLKPEYAGKNRMTTLCATIGLLWQNDRVSYGDKNPDKTFYLIKSRLGFQGLSDLIKFCLFRVDMAKSRKNIIPYIDMSVPGDNNQFNRGDGTNAWTMLFKQVNHYTPSEIYQSKNVIIGKEQVFSLNPYLAESRFLKDFSELVNDNLEINSSIRNSNEKLLKELSLDDMSKVLGVIARGTDYNNPAVLAPGVLKKPVDTRTIINAIKSKLDRYEFEKVFLATEDQDILDELMSSDISDKLYYVEQKRYSYKDLRTGLLSDHYTENHIDTYKMNEKYLGIIYILSQCGALLASTSCGAYQIATGLNRHKYLFNEVLNETLCN